MSPPPIDTRSYSLAALPAALVAVAVTTWHGPLLGTVGAALSALALGAFINGRTTRAPGKAAPDGGPGDLAAERDFLALALDSIGDGVIVVDAAGRITSLNPVACVLTGWRADDARGRALSDVFRLVDPAALAGALDRALAGQAGSGFADGSELLGADDRRHRVADSIAPIRAASGDVQGAILVFRDVSEAYALRGALETSERRLRAAVEGGEVGIWEWDAATDAFAHFGPWVERFAIEVSAGRLSGADHMRITHPDDRATVLEALLAHLKGEREIYSAEQRVLCRDGSYRRLLVRGNTTERDADGRPRKLIGTYTDITALRDEQQRLELALDAIPQGIIEWWPDEDRLRPTASWLRLTGYGADAPSTCEDFLGGGFVHAADRAALTRALGAFAAGTRARETTEFRLRFADGSYRWMLASGRVAETGSDGRPRRIVAIHIDNSSAKLAEQRLELALAGARAAIWEWQPQDDRFLASASWSEMFGFDAAEVPTMQTVFSHVMHRDDVANAQRELAGLASGALTHGEAEIRVRHRAGGYLRTLARASVVEHDGQGRARRVLGVAMDVSELVRARERLALALRAARQGLFEWNAQTDAMRFDESWAELTGHPTDGYPTLAAAAEAGIIHPDDMKVFAATAARVRAGEIDEFAIEFRLRRVSGEFQWMLSRGVVSERDDRGRALLVIGTNVDIGRYKQAEEFTRMAVEATGVGIWEWQLPEQRLVFAGERWLHLLGRSGATTVATAELNEWLHPDDRALVVRQLQTLLHGEAEQSEVLLRYRHAAGHYVLLLTRAFVTTRDNTGRVLRLAGTSIDITALRAAELEQESSRQFLRTVLDTVPVGISWKDHDSVYLGSNRQFAREAGVGSPATLIGLSDDDLAWREQAERMRSDERRLLDGSTRRIVTEQMYVDEHGAARWVESTKVPLHDGSGALLGILGVHHDVTASHRAMIDLEAERARLALVIHGSGAGIWDWDVGTDTLTVNPRWAEIFGADATAVANGVSPAHWRAAVHPDDLPRALAKQREIVINDGLYECDLRVRQSDGRWLWVHDTGRVTERAADGRATRLTGTVVDISARVERDRYLKAIAEAVTERRQGDLLSTIVATARELTETSYGFVAALDDDGEHATVIAHAPAEGPFAGARFRLAGTPCGTTMREDVCVYVDGLTAQFPDNRGFARAGFAAYAGQRLVDEHGQVRGLLVLFSTTPLVDAERTRAVLNILAVSASQELARERSASALRDSERRYRRIYETMPLMLCTLDAAGQIIDVNEAWSQCTGHPRERCLGQPVARFFSATSAARLAGLLGSAASVVRGERNLLELVASAGDTRLAAFTLFGSDDAAGTNLRILALEDVTARVEAEEQLRIAATAFETHGAMTVLDRERRILRVNQAFTELTQYERDEVVGLSTDLLRCNRHDDFFYQQKWRDVTEYGRWEGEMWVRRKDGSEFPVWRTITAVYEADNRVSHYVTNMIDLTERVRAEREVERLAFYDALTSLPNRRYLLDRLGAALAHARRHGGHGALLFIDLDHFKQINDSMGHAVGDQVLMEVGRRLLALTRTEDVVSRMGGDEFVIMLDDLGFDLARAREHADSAARKISSELARPYQVENYAFHMTPTIGITLFPELSETPNDILKQADAAMYQGKVAGRHTVSFYHESMALAATERMQLETELRAALADDALDLYFQPQVTLDQGVSGAEALLRWPHPTRGFVPPDKFIAVAEDSNLIHALGEWVVARALKVFKTWQEDGLDAVGHVSINVSSRQFRAPDFVQRIEQQRAEAGVDARHVVLELTERTVIDDIEGTIAKMNALRALGFRFSVDDFGIGYSSLAYLRRLPLDQLKVDRSFVLDVVEDAHAGVIAETIIAMGRQLGLETIAEGVEDVEQQNFLAARGCRGFQGYLFCRPVPDQEFRAFCRSFVTPEK